MILMDFVFVFIFALILSAILGRGFGWRHPANRDAAGPSMLFLFLILLFVMWAGGAWIPLWGPVWFGAPWLTLLLIGLAVALLILALAAPAAETPPAQPEAIREKEDAVAVGAVFGIFFWVLIAGLLIAVIGGYLV